jgi:predicted acylesterase/phospholipase RssA
MSKFIRLLQILMQREDSVRKLHQNEVKYIALEGGGGKGNAFLGALQALSDPKLNVGGAPRGILQYEQLRPINIKGFSGSSAGAITAMLLSCGYDFEEIKVIMEMQNFFDYLDKPELGKVPAIGGCRKVRSGGIAQMSEHLARLFVYFLTSEPSRMDNQISSPGELFGLVIPIFYALISRNFKQAEADAANILKQASADAANILNTLKQAEADAANILKQATSHPLDQYLQYAFFEFLVMLLPLLQLFSNKLPPEMFKLVSDNKVNAMKCLQADLGIFHGCLIREFFNKWIAIARYRVRHYKEYESKRITQGKEKTLKDLSREYDKKGGRIGVAGEPDLRETTFAQHEAEFGVRLAVTGSELEYFKSHVFSSPTTPNFRVADAVRISMSLPLLFKPFRLKDKKDLEIIQPPEHNSADTISADKLKGVWFDGGLFNNIPLHVFDNEEGQNPKTLGLRLQLEEREEINNIFQLLRVWPLGFFVGAGEAHVSYTLGNFDQAIILDTVIDRNNKSKERNIELLDFNIDAKTMEKLTNQSKQTTFTYFGVTP